MGEHVKIQLEHLKKLRDVDSRMVSYNVEMTEVTGGTFWSAYTEAQVDGEEEFIFYAAAAGKVSEANKKEEDAFYAFLKEE